MLPDDKDEPSTHRRGLYAKQLQNVYQHFKREQIVNIGLRDLVESTQSLLEQVYAFLGVASYPFDKIDANKENSLNNDVNFSAEDKQFLEHYYA